MNEENTSFTKQKLLINIGTILLSIACLASVVIVILYDFLGNFGNEKIPYICLGIGVFSLIAYIVLIRKSSKCIKVITLCLNIICICAGLVAFPLTVLRGLGDHLREERRNKGNELATIDKAFENIKVNTISLNNETSENSYIKCWDDDKTIATKFLSLNFTFDYKSYYCPSSPDYFALNMMKIYFLNDYTKVAVYVPAEHQMLGGGHDEGINYYTISEEEANELKALVDDKINRQIASCQEFYDSEKDKMDINDALDYFDKEESRHKIYFKENVNDSYSYGYDRQHIINSKLKAYDFSGATKTSSYSANDQTVYNIKFYDDSEYSYAWQYYREQNRLRIIRYLLVPYEGSKTFFEDYILPETISENLMNLVKETMQEIRRN